MIQQVQQQIANLNQAYLEGSLTYSDYRKTRGLMLDGLFDDITVTEEQDPATVPMQSTLNPPRPAPHVAEDDSNKKIYIAIAVLVVGIIAALVLLLGGS